MRFSGGGGGGGVNLWNEELTNDVRKKIEKHWSCKTLDFSRIDENNDKEKFYVLSMFPYPSGSLHMGHVRVYSISDVLARFFRMRGKNVIHPMGWDAFGLPAENAAFEKGINPDEWTQQNIANMKSVMEKLCFSFDWSREFATCDSDYYKWTQFLFLKLYERGLVYRKEAVVNWDPVDLTVLADEQVDANGRSWRSGAIVEKKLLKQWFVKTTSFSQLLYDGLEDPILEDWKEIKPIQRNWIGKLDGTFINFEIVGHVENCREKEISIWLKRPEYIDRGKFVAVQPGSVWTFGVKQEGLLPYRLKNPFTNESLPVYMTSEVKYLKNNDVYLGIPDLSETDKNFATSVGIKCCPGLQESASEEELLDLREKICSEARERGIGGHPASFKLRDWLISRQRFWGTPIPIIYCERCGEQPVPETDLPVKLPKVKYLKLGTNPLKEDKSWLNVKCPKCGSEGATRETDTMDTFVDSSWYFLRFLDPDNAQAGFNVEKIKKMMPVDIYIGGIEHATLHLYFARFMNHFLYSVDLVPHPEPFKRLLCQGLVKGKTFRCEKTGKYVRSDSVELKNKEYVDKKTGNPVVMNWEKMSKSKYNGVEPSEMIENYGVDALRTVILAEAAPRSSLNWDEKSFRNILMWQSKLWDAVKKFNDVRSKSATKDPSKDERSEEFKKLDLYLYDSRNFYVKKITSLLEKTFSVSVAIAKMQGLTNSLRKADEETMALSENYEKALATQIIMLAPIAPSFASELWSGFLKAPNRLSKEEGIDWWDKPLMEQKWPKVDEDYVEKSDGIVVDMLKLSNKTIAAAKEKKNETKKSSKKKLKVSGSTRND